MKDNPNLEDALDGLIDAANYCFEEELDDAAEKALAAYQLVGAEAPEEHFDEVDPDRFK